LIESPIFISNPSPDKVVVLLDTTFFSRYDGVTILRSYTTKQNLAWEYVSIENIESYRNLRREIESKGFEILAAVTDGKHGLREVFSDIPVQMCQFHMKMILRRYLTLRPRVEAAQALKKLTNNLTKISETEFNKEFIKWDNKWSLFLKERTAHPNGGSSFTHRKLRAARRSIIRHLPFLFTYQNYPDLNIPNTTNDIESMNSKLKDLLRIHRGYSKKLRNKIINEILSKN